MRATPGIAFARIAHQLAGGATIEESEGKLRAALADAGSASALAARLATLEADAKARAERDADTALDKKLAAAVRARKYARTDLFDFTTKKNEAGEDVEVRTPQAWVRAMSPAAVDAMIAAKQARLGAGDPPPIPEDKPVHISAAVRAYAARRGITDEKKIAALAANMGAVGAPQEH
jgi:hypothetical protein